MIDQTAYCRCGGTHRRAYRVINRARNWWGCGTCGRPTRLYLENVIRKQVAQNAA
jgi:hypothetical protein